MGNHFFIIKSWPKGKEWSFHDNFKATIKDVFPVKKIKKDFEVCEPGDEAIGFDTLPYSSAYCICKIISKNEKEKTVTAEFSNLLDFPVSQETMEADPILSKTKFIKAMTANSGRGITLFRLEKSEFDRIILLSKSQIQAQTKTRFTWIPFYMELADKFAGYSDKKQEFLNNLINSFKDTGVAINPHIIGSELCDPFTAIGQFNHGNSDSKRIAVCTKLKQVFGMVANVPTDFEGFPAAWYNHADYAWTSGIDEKAANDILWSFFLSMLEATKVPSEATRTDFIVKYDQVHQIEGLTNQMPSSMCFWFRPYDFLTLDSKTSKIIQDSGLLDKKEADEIKAPDGATYLGVCAKLKLRMSAGKFPFKDFPELSAYAYDNATTKNSKTKQTIANAVANPTSQTLPDYSENDFVKEVFLEKESYSELKNLLIQRKNIILTGTPGVGKTFAATRLAYSILGTKDDSKIQFVQFHQNYSYEDFVIGYKPAEDGSFKLREGTFYSFCNLASKDPSHPYFFIIDEINRGNLSKIFGELLMMIERDYRGKPVCLVYKDELHKDPFVVPENVYLIGMMNTADRSIAMIDYALRRRFSFFEMKPAFDTQGFRDYLDRIGSPQLNKLIDVIKELNIAIDSDDSLGEGYEIGHSYFIQFFGNESTHKADYSKEWLSAIVKYDLIPTLHEYWFDNIAMYKDWAARLKNAIN